MVAIPRKEAKTNMDLIFCNDKKPSIETDPIIKRPTNTATPIITLLLMFKNLYARNAKIKKPKSMIADTTVLPEKNPGTKKQSCIKSHKRRRNPVTAIQFLAIRSQKRPLLLEDSVVSGG